MEMPFIVNCSHEYKSICIYCMVYRIINDKTIIFAKYEVISMKPMNYNEQEKTFVVEKLCDDGAKPH